MSTSAAWRDVVVVVRGPMRIFFVGQLLSSIGGGLTLSLLVVYLHQVRGIPIPIATAVLSWLAVVGLAAAPLVGTATDRYGPRPVLIAAAAVEAVAVYLYGTVTSAPAAFLVGTLAALGAAGIWAPAHTLIAHAVPEERRPAAFGLNFMLLNLGLGMGGLIGSLIVDVDRPSTFVTLYTVDAISYVLFLVSLLALRGVGGRPPQRPSEGDMPQAGWPVVLQDRNLRRYVVVSMLMLTFGYASIESGFAIFVTTTAGLDEHWIGVAFFVNTITIVISQLTVLGLVSGRSRTRVLGLVGLLWAVAWLALPFAPGRSTAVAVAMVLAFMAVFAVGETLWSPTAPALLNTLAPDHLRGRYNAASGLTWSVSAMIGPVIAGALIGAGQGVVWALGCGVGCVAGGLLAQRLRRHLSAAQDGRRAAVADAA